MKTPYLHVLTYKYFISVDNFSISGSGVKSSEILSQPNVPGFTAALQGSSFPDIGVICLVSHGCRQTLGNAEPFPRHLVARRFLTTIPGRTNRQLNITNKTMDRPYVYSEAGTYRYYSSARHDFISLDRARSGLPFACMQGSKRNVMTDRVSSCYSLKPHVQLL